MLSPHPPPHSKTIPYARQCIEEDDIEAVSCALRSPLITRGPFVAEFEQKLANLCQVPHAIAFSNGSTALMAACLALNLGPEDRILVPANTFVATASCAAFLGCTVVFVDVDPLTGNLDLKSLLPHLLENLPGKCILMPVHFAGRALDLARIRKLATNDRILIIEDAAHALGSCYPTLEKVGSCVYSDVCAFSFHAIKNITTGEGGAVTTRSDQLAQRLRRVRNSGIERDPTRWRLSSPGPWYYEVQEISTNFHISEMQAALGISQLGKLERFQRAKEQLIERYCARLMQVPEITLPPFSKKALSHYHLFFILLDFKQLKNSRQDLMQYLQSRQIGSQVLYIPLNRHTCLKGQALSVEPLAGCESFYSQMLALPLYVNLTLEEVDWICDHILLWLQNGDLQQLEI